MRIAITGAGIICAAGNGTEQTLESIRLLRSGVGKVTLFPTEHDVPVCEVKYSNHALKRLLKIPAGQHVSRTALLGMVAARQALDDAQGGRTGENSGEAGEWRGGSGRSGRNNGNGSAGGNGLRTGLISATSVGGMDLTEDFYREFLACDSGGRLRDVVGHACGDSTEKIAACCGIDGFTSTISTACSSAANAIILGAQLIRRGILDRVIAGGTDALCRFTLNGFKSLMILDGEHCRPFDDSRAGLNLGEGAGYVVLQRDDTLDREPYCYLTGYANANDAFHQTASSENGEGAYLAMREALEKSGLEPREIDYINAHGTGTSNNDASEAAAIVRLFGSGTPRFSSTKPFTGHTLAAAGGIEAVLAVLAVAKGIIYPNLNFKTPMRGTGPVPETAYREGEKIGNVLSNSFGFGGNNSTLIFSAR